MNNLSFKNKVMKQIEMKQKELKELKELIAIPSEYKIIKLISDKYNICPDLEEMINGYLQKIKMKKSLSQFERRYFYDNLRDCSLLRRRAGFLRVEHSWTGKHHYCYDMIDGENISYNLYGIKIDNRGDIHYSIKKKYGKEHIKDFLERNEIKYLKSDTKHALICRLLGKNPKDPVYTKEVRKRI